MKSRHIDTIQLARLDITPLLPDLKSTLGKDARCACDHYPYNVRKHIVTGTDTEGKTRQWCDADVAQETENTKDGSETRLKDYISKWGGGVSSQNISVLMERYNKYCGICLTIKWKYCVLVRQDGPTQ